jgi:hypothetical protein
MAFTHSTGGFVKQTVGWIMLAYRSRLFRKIADCVPEGLFFICMAIVLGTLLSKSACGQQTPEAAESAKAEAPTSETASTNTGIKASLGAGGVKRFLSGRWGLVSGQVRNLGDRADRILMVVTPEGGTGLQYSRLIEIPANMAFETNWPVRLNDGIAGTSVNFEYLEYPGGNEDGVIRHKNFDKQIPSFYGITRPGAQGLTVWIPQSGGTSNESAVSHFMRAMRVTRSGDMMVSMMLSTDFSEHREALDAVDQVAVADSNLSDYPLACSALRNWVRRGGQLMLALDQCGNDVAKALLGETMSMTVVGKTTTNTVRLDLNPDYPTNQYPVRFVERAFDEPVGYLRVIPDNGEVIWSIDGWPVAMRIGMGAGTVLVTTVSPEVFLLAQTTDGTTPPYGLVDSCRRMSDALFSPRSQRLITEATASQQAAAMIGYEIPSRTVATVILTLFPVLLTTGAWYLGRQSHGERLIWVLPVLALTGALPAVALGFRSRSVAPTTVIESSVVYSSDSASDYVIDGYATLYSPTQTDLEISTSKSVLTELRGDSTNRDYRRLLWTSPQQNTWSNLEVNTGLRTFPVRAEVDLNGTLSAEATFNQDGLTGRLQLGDMSIPQDLLLATIHADRMALSVRQDGTFTGSDPDVLASEQFSTTTMVSEQQAIRARTLETLFQSTDRYEPFPQEPVVMFWTSLDEPCLQLPGTDIRQLGEALFIQPLKLLPPAPETQITIPGPLMAFRAIVNSDGSYSAVYDNPHRRWMPSESAVKTLLQFRIPQVCQPFDPESATLSILIRAPSRVVEVLAGSEGSLQSLARFDSPLGSRKVVIPGDLIRETARDGTVIVQVNVGGLDASMTESMAGEQDDSWQIEQLSLSLKGQRVP